MGRRYQVGPGESFHFPPAGSAVDVHGVGPRHWDLLAVLAQFAVLDTGQVAELMFGSRPAAVRHLRVLVKAGLAVRFVFDKDPSHRAHYEVSHDGIRHLTERLRRSAVPVSVGHEHRDQFTVNDFLIGLTRAAGASSGRAWLYGWRPGSDVVVWLQRLGIAGVQPRAAGVWLQDGRAVRFLLHVDDDTPGPYSGGPASNPVHALGGYRHATAGIPASCLLVVCPTAQREQLVQEGLAVRPLSVAVATTTIDTLAVTDDPSGPIWTVTAGELPARLRLIDLAAG